MTCPPSTKTVYLGFLFNSAFYSNAAAAHWVVSKYRVDWCLHKTKKKRGKWRKWSSDCSRPRSIFSFIFFFCVCVFFWVIFYFNLMIFGLHIITHPVLCGCVFKWITLFQIKHNMRREEKKCCLLWAAAVPLRFTLLSKLLQTALLPPSGNSCHYLSPKTHNILTHLLKIVFQELILRPTSLPMTLLHLLLCASPLLSV